MTTHNLLGLVREAEAALGENLVWIADQADLGIRQKDPETLRRLKHLDDAWKKLVTAIATIDRAAAKAREHLLDDGRKIRHDMHGFYICTMDEAAHEDEGNASVGFDGRMHWPTSDAARRAFEAGGA